MRVRSPRRAGVCFFGRSKRGDPPSSAKKLGGPLADQDNPVSGAALRALV